METVDMSVDKKIVLVGAGSASFGPPTLKDIYSSDILTGSTIVLHDIDEEKLNLIHDIVVKENKIAGSKYNIIKTTDRKKALKNADFVICSIENGDRFELRWQDNTIPHELGTTEMMAENGGPGAFFHSARQIPEIVQIAKELYHENPHAFFINYSNPMSRICLAIKRAVPDLKFIGLCHQIGLFLQDLPYIVDDSLQNEKLKEISLNEKYELHGKSLKEVKIVTGGLNHFAFILGLEDKLTGENLLPKFNDRVMDYYEDKWDRFKYADLTFEVYKRYGWFPYVGDNHLAEYLIFGSEFTNYQDFRDWIKRMEDGKMGTNKRFRRYHKRLKKGRYPEKGYLVEGESDERGIPIIEELISGDDAYEIAINIPNNNIIENLPQDLVIECSARIRDGFVEGVKLGKIPKNIASLLRVEASTQDICVEAILSESKDLAINCIATDVNCGSFEMAEKIYDRMYKIQRKYLPNFK
ncbi:MAG: Alpha-glucosidase [Promethearchaeota archaeon]|nr:MAG: Alpha-glucosidase [Candidatus Lokiarchaeota archaeon]